MQADDPLDLRYEGNGLGLPPVRKFVAMHGGEVELDGTPGVGTIVSILLPANRVIEAARNPRRRTVRVQAASLTYLMLSMFSSPGCI